MTGKKIILICLGVILLYAIGFGSMIWAIKQDKIDLNKTNEKLLTEQSFNSTCSYKRDSLFRINADLSKFKELTLAMVYRDDVTGPLKHKVGDLVYMKNDSSRVVIEDVLIGGGKYNYYVKFKVLYKDHSSKEIVPELIY